MNIKKKKKKKKKKNTYIEKHTLVCRCPWIGGLTCCVFFVDIAPRCNYTFRKPESDSSRLTLRLTTSKRCHVENASENLLCH